MLEGFFKFGDIYVPKEKLIYMRVLNDNEVGIEIATGSEPFRTKIPRDTFEAALRSEEDGGDVIATLKDLPIDVPDAEQLAIESAAADGYRFLAVDADGVAYAYREFPIPAGGYWGCDNRTDEARLFKDSDIFPPRDGVYLIGE